MADTRWGATPEEWCLFSDVLGLTADLLPVVSNPNAEISGSSHMEALGKTPSMYNRSRTVAGIAKWTSAYTEPEQIARWQKEADYGICLQTRKVRALDVDVEDPAEAKAICDFITSKLGQLPIRYRDNSPRRLFLVNIEGGLGKRKIKTGKGIVEFLAFGQQCVVAGTHPSGARYQWERLDDIPTVTLGEFEVFWEDFALTFGVDATEQPKAMVTRAEALKRAVDSDPIAGFLYDQNMVVAELGEGRLGIVCPFHEEHTTESAASSTTYFVAHTGGYANGHFHCLHGHCEGRRDHEFLDKLGYSTGALDFDEVPPAEQEKAPEFLRQEGRFKLQSVAQFASAPPAKWLVKGLIIERAFGIIYGEPACGKTFFTLDLVGRLALGQEWRGVSAKRPLNVTYLCAEGVAGFRNRLNAFMQLVDKTDIPNMTIVTDAPDLLVKEQVSALARLIGPSDLVVFDTFAAVMAGDENSGEDMGRAIRNAQMFGKATGAAVLVVHHTPKVGGGARGHSSLKGAADVEIEVSRFDNGDRSALVTKLKDGADGADYGFRLSTTEIGRDEDGDPITSCVVHYADNVERPVKRVRKQKAEVQVTRSAEEMDDLKDQG